MSDFEKVKAVTNISLSGDPEGVLRLNGIANYLGGFLPHLTDLMRLIGQLTHRELEMGNRPTKRLRKNKESYQHHTDISLLQTGFTFRRKVTVSRAWEEYFYKMGDESITATSFRPRRTIST